MGLNVTPVAEVSTLAARLLFQEKIKLPGATVEAAAQAAVNEVARAVLIGMSSRHRELEDLVGRTKAEKLAIRAWEMPAPRALQ